MATQTDLAVAGVGNRWARDDAIGLYLVEALVERQTDAGIEILYWENADALTLTHDLLGLRTPVLIVDCADMGLAAGCWQRLSPQTARLRVHTDALSTHGLGVAEALSLAESLGFDKQVEVFGIQPFDVSPSLGLSPAMERRFPHLLRALETRVRAARMPDRNPNRAKVVLAKGLRSARERTD